MAKLILVCGPVGVGKTTYALSLCEEIGGVRFSIDPWMQTLYAKDMTSLDFKWMMERVNRCYEQIWETSNQILLLACIIYEDSAPRVNSTKQVALSPEKRGPPRAEGDRVRCDVLLALASNRQSVISGLTTNLPQKL